MIYRMSLAEPLAKRAILLLVSMPRFTVSLWLIL